MTVPYSLRQQGWMQADNGSPCLTEAQAVALGLPLDYARRSVVEVDLLHCKCCGGVVLKNPDRVRPRAHCHTTNWFQCDPCAYLHSQSDFVCVPFLEKVERAKTAAANLACI